MISLVLATLANALGRRFAGGLLGQWFGNIGGTQVARLTQALIVGATIALLAPVWWWGAAAVPAAFLGATVGFPKCGMVPRSAADVLMIGVRHGLLALLPLAALMGALAWWRLGAPTPAMAVAAPLLLAGFLRGRAYWLATKWQPHFKPLGLNPHGIPDPPAMAELYSGALLGAGLWLAMWGIR